MPPKAFEDAIAKPVSAIADDHFFGVNAMPHHGKASDWFQRRTRRIQTLKRLV
jgi:hypothetical protein